MLSEKRFLALRFEGPLQSWGFDSQYNRRNTGLMPTKSAIAGMCCAALGFPRGDEQERDFLVSFGPLRMTSIALPREGMKRELPVRRLQDYHTVGGGYDIDDPCQRQCVTVTAEDRKPRAKNGQSLAVLTHRQYLTDAAFGIVLEGDANLLSKIACALANPTWGLWLGRKSCIPTAPVLIGLKEHMNNPRALLKDTLENALRPLIGDKPYESFTRQEEAEHFVDGLDSIPDVPISFESGKRLFSPRRVRTHHGTGTP